MIVPIRITNPDKVFTPVFTRLWECNKRFVINYGGTGSSKSYSAAQKEVLKSCEIHDRVFLVLRKTGSTLRDSVIPSFRRRIKELKLERFFTYNKSERELTNTVTNTKIVFRGLDDPEKMKSFEGLQRIMMEEASEFDLEDMFEINRRARGVPDIQITINFNPIHENHWLKKHYFDEPLPNAEIIHSTYKDNPFLTDEDREQIEWMKKFNYNQYRVYALGEWGITENNTPWLFAFNREKHVKKLAIMNTFPIYLTFDFNRNPVTCLAVQMSPAKGVKDSFVHFVKEFVINETLKELCERIRSAFPSSLLYVTGDASGNRGDVGFENKNSTYYNMIKSYLRIHDKFLNLNSKNLEHNDSRLLCNTMMSEYPNVFIDPSCATLINDCIIATVDEDKMKAGMLKKDREIYKMDSFDAFRYFWQTYFKEWAERVFPVMHKKLAA